jgi:hypothetical protein
VVLLDLRPGRQQRRRCSEGAVTQRSSSHGTPASDTPRPGSARACGMGLGVAGPHYSAAFAERVGTHVMSVHRYRKHNQDGCAERAHDREWHGFVAVFHLLPPVSRYVR